MYDIHNLTNAQVAYLKNNISCKGVNFEKARQFGRWVDVLSIITNNNNMINVYKDTTDNIYKADVVKHQGWFTIPEVSSTIIGEIKNGMAYDTKPTHSKHYYRAIMRNIEREHSTEPNGLVLNLTSSEERTYKNAEKHVLD